MIPVLPSTGDQLRVVSLFSGIGGFERGLSRTGHRIVVMCESDPAARAVLRTHFPNTHIEPDITTMAGLPDCDVLTAGWPCQDLSLAGGTLGMDGTRSGLISEVFRLIASSLRRPRYVLLENVPFALDLHGGRAVSAVVSKLEELGYCWAYRILDARAFGLPQRRRRLFILGALDTDPGSILLDGLEEGGLATEPDPALVGFYWTEGTRGLGWSPEAVPPLKGGSGLGIPSPPAVWVRATGFFITPGIEDAERLQGFPVGWTSAASQVAKGERRRWVLVGNAVSVPIVEWIGRRLSSPACQRGESERLQTTRLGLPRAASGGPGLNRLSFAPTREGPTVIARTTLNLFGLRNPSKLSVRAIAGFTRRYEVSPLRKNTELLEALRAWVDQDSATAEPIPA